MSDDKPGSALLPDELPSSEEAGTSAEELREAEALRRHLDGKLGSRQHGSIQGGSRHRSAGERRFREAAELGALLRFAAGAEGQLSAEGRARVRRELFASNFGSPTRKLSRWWWSWRAALPLASGVGLVVLGLIVWPQSLSPKRPRALVVSNGPQEPNKGVTALRSPSAARRSRSAARRPPFTALRSRDAPGGGDRASRFRKGAVALSGEAKRAEEALVEAASQYRRKRGPSLPERYAATYRVLGLTTDEGGGEGRTEVDSDDRAPSPEATYQRLQELVEPQAREDGQVTPLWVRRDLFCRLADSALELARAEQALRWVRRGVALGDEPHPLLAELYVLRARAHRALGNREAAAESYSRALDVHERLLDDSLGERVEGGGKE